MTPDPTPTEQTYLVNEIYYTIHGEGVRYGVPHVFVRFAGCNLECSFCDTEFESGQHLTAAEIVAWATRLADAQLGPEPPDTMANVVGARRSYAPTVPHAPCRNVLFCGGEPLLQLDAPLLAAFKASGWYTVVETNGSRPAPEGLDWITCSPKVAEHAIALDYAHELKYVRALGQGIPRPRIHAGHYLISPCFEGNGLDAEVLAHCLALVRANPQWRLTVQHHKVSFGGIR
jgi:organic radical activating enzyme